MLSADQPSRHYAPRRYSPRSHSPNILTTMNGVSVQPDQPDHIEHIWIVTGPAGCGKTTVAQYLARQLSVPYVEGDDYHPASNKDKMSKNIPLTDADRWDWLITLREAAVKQLQHSNSVIVTCSALKHKYRDVIRVANYEHPSVQIHFIYLKLDRKTLEERVLNRVGHYMKAEMVQSQLATLEDPDEEWDVLAVDATGMPSDVDTGALEMVRKKLAEYPSSASTS